MVDGAALEKRCAKAPRVRIPPSPPDSSSPMADRRLPVGLIMQARRPRRGRLVDYGAALEMRFGATRRGFESRPLRQQRPPRERRCGRWLRLVLPHAPSSALAAVLPGRLRLAVLAAGWRAAAILPPAPSSGGSAGRSLLDSRSRARRGTSGALYLQSAPAGLNSHPRSPFSKAAASSDVEDRVPRSGDSRTVSGPEGSSTKRTSSGAAERPGPSRSSRRARGRSGRRWVHGKPIRRPRSGAP